MQMFKAIKRMFERPPEFIIYGICYGQPSEREMMRIRSKEFMTEAAVRDRLEITDQFRITRIEERA